MLMMIVLLHYLGLGGVTVACLLAGMYDLALVNGAVFLVMTGAEAVMLRPVRVYTAPMPITVDKVPAQPEAEPEAEPAPEIARPSMEMPLPTAA